MRTGDIALALVVFGGAYLLWKNGAFSFMRGAPGSAGRPTAAQTQWALTQMMGNGNIGPFADGNVYAAGLDEYNSDPTQSGS